MRLGLVLMLAVTSAAPMAAARRQTPPPGATFKAGVDRVTVTAVVRTRSGQPVTTLTRGDFDVLDNGEPRPILEFRAEPTPATVALLVDLSGSMTIAPKLAAARAAAADILKALTPGVDRAGLYGFDTELHELQPLQAAPGDLLTSFDAIHPFGSTSLFDAIAETGKRLAADGSTRRAVVALTDGGENSSRLTASEVTRIASEIDVPVYIVVLLPSLDQEDFSKADARAAEAALGDSPLGHLARWTGGEIFQAATDVYASHAALQIVDELRHQYFIGFAPDTGRPGWHPIDVRIHQKDLVVRARSGYVAQHRPNSQ